MIKIDQSGKAVISPIYAIALRVAKNTANKRALRREESRPCGLGRSGAVRGGRELLRRLPAKHLDAQHR